MAAAWTLKEGEEFLNSIRPLLVQFGYSGQIVGSVKRDGYSNKDLDILLTSIHEDNESDIEELAYDSRWQLIEADANYEMFTVLIYPEHKIVDFWVGKLEESVVTEDKVQPHIEFDEWMEPNCKRHRLAIGETHNAWAWDYLYSDLQARHEDEDEEEEIEELRLEDEANQASSAALIGMGWVRLVRFPGKLYFNGRIRRNQLDELKSIAGEEERDLINGANDRVIFTPQNVRMRPIIQNVKLVRPDSMSVAQFNFMRGESVLTEMPYVYKPDNYNQFDLELERFVHDNDKDGCIKYIQHILSGKPAIDKYGNAIQLDTPQDRKKFKQTLQHNPQFNEMLGKLGISAHKVFWPQYVESFKQYCEMTDASVFGPPSTPYADGDARIPFAFGTLQKRPPFMKKKKRKKKKKVPYGALTTEAVLTTNQPTEEQKELIFNDLAQEQRGAPEIAMLRVQKAVGGGLLSFVAEHLGDLIHRMSEQVTYSYGGYGFVHEKVEKVLRVLKSRYGFVREVDDNYRSNASYYKISEDELRAKVKEKMKEYVKEHSKLPIYNRMQWLANRATIHFGNENYLGATDLLENIQAELEKGEQHWTEVCHAWEPKYFKPTQKSWRTLLDELQTSS